MFNISKALALATMVCAAPFSVAQAEDWAPEGPITLQVGFGAGGSTDTLSRVLAQEIENNTGWTVVVENRPGGGGVAMLSGLAHKEPNGLTLGVGVTIPIVINLAARGESLPFAADSFDYIGTITSAPLAIAAPIDAPFNDFRELVAYAQSNNGANVGFDGGVQQQMLLAVNNTDDTGFRPVSFGTSAEVIQSMLGGHLDAGFVGGAHVAYIESGRLKMIASATADRHAYAPESETLVEQGYPYFVDGYFFIAAPKGLPAEVAETLEAALTAAVASEALNVVTNGMSLEAINIGGAETLSRMVDGTEAAKVLIEASSE